MPTMSSADASIIYGLFKGEPGTRKSTAALSFPGPQYWFSFDRKMNGMMLPMKEWGIDPKTVTYDDYSNWDKMRDKLEQFRLNCPYKTIIVDSITTLADASIRQVQKIKSGASSGPKGKVIGNIPVAGFEEFNAEASALLEMIALTKDISEIHRVNVILIAHVIQTEVKSADGNTHMSRVIVTAAKKVAAKIPGYCGEVYHFNIKKGFDASLGGQYALFTEHTGDDFARTALPLDREIVFGNKPLYATFLLPAIQKLMHKEPDPNQVKF